jgi:hypothetical protein
MCGQVFISFLCGPALLSMRGSVAVLLGWCKASKWRDIYMFWGLSYPSVRYTISQKLRLSLRASVSNVEHIDHQCEDRECPAPCQLCNRMCSGGHLHGLQSGEHHHCGCVYPCFYHKFILKQYLTWLFRKEHPCSALCSAGICEIQTKPHALETTFVGTHSTFQYTRVSPCS